MTFLSGYDQCRILTGANFENVFNLNLWASNAELINCYMLYGQAFHSCTWCEAQHAYRGTSWGALPFPGVYSEFLSL